MSFRIKPKNSSLKSHLTLDVLKLSSSPKKASTEALNDDFGQDVADISGEEATDKTRLFAGKLKRYWTKVEKNPSTTKSCAELFPSETSSSSNSNKSMVLGSQYRSMVFYNNPRLIIKIETLHKGGALNLYLNHFKFKQCRRLE